jgi:hypothetical protein
MIMQGWLAKEAVPSAVGHVAAEHYKEWAKCLHW